MRNVDYYSVLGVSRTASAEDLKRRYRQLVRNHHPDVAADQEAAHERFILIVEAYRVLSDPVRRRAYDARQQAVPPPVRTQSVQVQEQIDDWFRHAVHRLEQGDLGGAAAQCRKILALDGHHAAAQAMLGDVHVQRQEWDQALVFYSGAVSAAPRNPAYARKLRLAAEAGQQARQAAER
ncbi:MAG: DnaJ domain-containing protein, partial [Armatimonadetes bacterium]|nr:DnaJ domain-containing protein [Armatimonadota bacterium]